MIWWSKDKERALPGKIMGMVCLDLSKNSKLKYQILFGGLTQDRSNSSALAMELLQSCAKPLISWSVEHSNTWFIWLQYNTFYIQSSVAQCLYTFSLILPCYSNLPGQMAEVTVCRCRYNFTVNGTELVRPVAECDDLRRTHKGEVQWVEEKDKVFAFVVIEGDVLELSFDDSGTLEGRSGLGQLQLRHDGRAAARKHRDTMRTS